MTPAVRGSGVEGARGREVVHKNWTTNQKSKVTVAVWRPRQYMATTRMDVAFGVRGSNAFFPLN